MNGELKMIFGRKYACPCGSKRKHEECCGYPFPESTPPRIPIGDLLPIGRSFDLRSADNANELVTATLFRRGNLALAEAMLRTASPDDISHARKQNQLGWIACAIGKFDTAVAHFRGAISLMPEWELPSLNLARVQSRNARPTNTGAMRRAADRSGYLLVRAWGYGFWSDVFHVAGQLLFAEMTNRIPIVYWGGGSLFSDDSETNAFCDFFKCGKEDRLHEAMNSGVSYWPPKWNARNVLGPDVHKFDGPYSRASALYCLERSEDVLVSDFYSGVIDLLPWVPPDHPCYHGDIDEIYRYLFSKYIVPTDEVGKLVDHFVSEQFGTGPFLAVHVRGSDKIAEVTDLEQRNATYFDRVDAFLATSREARFFLMTDDANILAGMKRRYGERVCYTNARRTESSQGVHYQEADSRKHLGIEVLVDTCIASRANCFIGNGASNVSLAVSYMRNWDRADCYLIGDNTLHGYGHIWGLQNW